MKTLSSKRKIRIEKKKRKMAALLEISKLNESDRLKNKYRVTNELSSIEVEPSPKKLRTDTESKTDGNGEVQIGISGKPLLYGEDYIKLKRMLREKTNKMRSEPKFRLREIGVAATLQVDIKERIPLFLSDIQHLVLYSQIGHHSPYSPARWCQLDKFNKLQNTNILIIENISLYHYESYETSFPSLKEFSSKLEIITSGTYKGDLVQDFATCPLTGTQMKKFVSQFGSLQDAVVQSPELYDRIKDLFPFEYEVDDSVSNSLPPSDKFPRTHLLLSGWQMVEENFPLPIKGLMNSKYAGYVLTKDSYKDVTPFSPMFGVDCEMCRTSSGDLELTRVSMVDENYQVIYEELVKPENDIVDYLTRFSGITAKLMKNVKKRLKHVQDDLRKILPADAILVGQSLSNDLHALKMMHPYVIDTSVIYNITGDRTRKTKLQTLSLHFLDLKIQEGRKGHCSIEDSSASLKLTKHKLNHDIHYGDSVMSNIAAHVQHYPDLGHPNYATSVFKHISKIDKTVRVVSLEEVIVKYHFFTFKEQQPQGKKINLITQKNNKSIVQEVCKSTDKCTLNIAHLRFTEAQIEREPMNIFKQINDWVKNIYEAMVAPGLCIVIFGGQRENGNGCCFITIKRLP